MIWISLWLAYLMFGTLAVILLLMAPAVYREHKVRAKDRQYRLTVHREKVWAECHRRNREQTIWEQRAAALLTYSYRLEAGNPWCHLYEGRLRKRLATMELADAAALAR